MNKLLRYNPEPFDGEFEVRSEFEDEALEQEDEVRVGRTGGRLGRATRMPRAFRPAVSRLKVNSARPPRSTTSGWPKGRRRYWVDPVGVPLWPYAVAGDPPTESQQPSDYIRWVQAALNGALGLRLRVSGLMNAPTRSAIRLLQERRGLAVTGRLGPDIDSALRDVGDVQAGSPPASGADAEPPSVADAGPPATDDTPAAPDGADQAGELEQEPDVLSRQARSQRGTTASAPGIKTLRTRIVQIARREAARWKNGRLQETSSDAIPILQEYWKYGPGQIISAEQLGSKSFQASHPWSAAFISFVMRKAGAGKAFKYAAAHSVYIAAAKANRIAGNSNPYKAYRTSEVAPRTGDLICRSRAGSGATYDNIRPGMKTHCDIVVDVKPGAVTVVGGNVGNSVVTRTVRIDTDGRVTEPLVFAVIRLGQRAPPVPGDTRFGTPRPATPPTPSQAASAPRLLKQETAPPKVTRYVEIDLNITDRFGKRAAPMTGIFLPEGLTPGSSVDIILYLHGHKGEKVRELTIDQYWNAARFSYGALREKLNAAGRRAILVAPTLGARSEAGRLVEAGGLDDYLAQVLVSLGTAGKSAPTLRHLILACHSGGGLPMRKVVGGRNKALASLRECWGFDCTYNHGDDAFWAGWARKTPEARCYFYYIKGSPTAPLSESLKAMRVANAIVQQAGDARHNFVPITHWIDRIEGASDLEARDDAIAPPKTPPGSLIPSPDPPCELADLKALSHPDFIEFVGARARKAMAVTGVPASVTVAQAVVETGWGRHTIGSAKNLFGIKGRGPAGSVRASTREFVNGQWTTVEADFAKYESFEQSIMEHARFFLRNKRYAPALAARDNADSFARAIHKAGYATAPDYATALIRIMKANNLYRFDRPQKLQDRGAVQRRGAA